MRSVCSRAQWDYCLLAIQTDCGSKAAKDLDPRRGGTTPTTLSELTARDKLLSFSPRKCDHRPVCKQNLLGPDFLGFSPHPLCIEIVQISGQDVKEWSPQQSPWFPSSGSLACQCPFIHESPNSALFQFPYLHLPMRTS